MKAIVKGSKEQGLSLISIDKPQVNKDEVLINIRISSICGSDLPIYFWDDEWTRNVIVANQIIGHEFCGEIIEVGEDVRNLTIGMFVTVEGHLFCGTCFYCMKSDFHICENQKLVGFNSPGGFADYISVPETNVIPLDVAIPFEIGALCDPLGNALHALSKVNHLNKSIFVSGCGPIGLMIIILLKIGGANDIIATDPVAYRRDLAKKVGATLTVNPYNSESLVNKKNFSDNVDIWVETSGAENAYDQGFDIIRLGGEVVLLGLPKAKFNFDFSDKFISKGLTVYGIIGRDIYDTWNDVINLLKNNSTIISSLQKIITHRFSFDEYDEAFMLARSGECGKILLFP